MPISRYFLTALPYFCRSKNLLMTGIDHVELEKVIVHKVGNPSRNEELKLSINPLTLNDEIVRSLLNKYFLGAFNADELFRFTHISDVNLNEVYNYVTKIFDDGEAFTEESFHLAQYLYSKSTHARVKEGELYVVLFNKVPFQGEETKAIGLFKSETKETFLKVFPHGQSYEVIHEEGVNINKLDKGCLIFRKNREEGYFCCVVDSTNKQNDTQYWVHDFLQVQPYSDAYHQTDQYLDLCKQFITQEYPEKFEVTKSDQIDMMNRSMEYFKTKDQFNMEEFAREVMHHEEIVDTFSDYKRNFEQNRGFEINEEFDIHLAAVKKQQKVFKSILKLDKNFHIYIHGRKDLMERGYDEAVGKKYYKIYFDEEA